MLVSQAYIDAYNQGYDEGYNEGRLKVKKDFIRSVLNYEMNKEGKSKEQVFKYINELDPSYYPFELIEEIYSTLDS